MRFKPIDHIAFPSSENPIHNPTDPNVNRTMGKVISLDPGVNVLMTGCVLGTGTMIFFCPGLKDSIAHCLYSISRLQSKRDLEAGK